MRKNCPGIILLLLTCAFASCKKDVLHLKKVREIPGNTTYRLNNIRILSSGTVLIAGGERYNQAEVLRSTDGGYSFTSTSYPQIGKGMYGFAVSPNGDLYLCGTDGLVVRSTDEGLNWTAKHLPDWGYYNAISYPVPDTGYAVSTTLQKASSISMIDNNGNVLKQQSFTFGMNNIYMVNSAMGYALGYGAVLKTTDHGQTWNFLDVKGDNFMAMDIHTNELWLCGYAGSVFHSWDGGKSWECYRNGNDPALVRYNILDIVFKDNKKGWAVCDDGKLLYSNDGGKHWAEYDRFCTSALRSIKLCANGDLLMAGDSGKIYRVTP